MQGGVVLLLAHLRCRDEVVHFIATRRAHGLCAGLSRGLQPPITKELRSTPSQNGHNDTHLTTKRSRLEVEASPVLDAIQPWRH